MKFHVLLFLVFFIPISSLSAQMSRTVEICFRLYDKDGKIISPYRFETEVELYANRVGHNNLIHQKRLLFDDRSYYFLYQCDQPGKEGEQLYFILNQDTLGIKLYPLAAKNLVIDKISIEQGQSVIDEKSLEVWEGLVRPEKRNRTLHSSSLRIEAKTEGLPEIKAMERIRFPNHLEIMRSKG